MQLQTTSPESKFPNEYSDVIFIQIDQHLKKLLQKYKGGPILWIMVYKVKTVGPRYFRSLPSPCSRPILPISFPPSLSSPII